MGHQGVGQPYRNCYFDAWNTAYSQGNGSQCEECCDELHCWPTTPSNRVATAPCSIIIGKKYDSVSAAKVPEHALAFRECYPQGRWANLTNYTVCMDILKEIHQQDSLPEETLQIICYITFVGSLISLVLLSITMFIFCYFKALHCNRLSVHKNLVAALLLRFILLILVVEPGITHREGTTYRDVEWVCKTVVSLKLYATLASVSWMFNEGFYLHSRITISIFNFQAPFKLFHVIGWGIPGLLVVVWVICMQSFHLSSASCWQRFIDEPYIWIVIAPMLLALGINLLFLINIIRILVTKLRANNTMETDQIKKAVKATVVLFPLLGVPNLFFFVNPDDDGGLEAAYFITNAILQSLQGIFVAILYCFLNTEVRLAIRKRYFRVLLRRQGSSRGTRSLSTAGLPGLTSWRRRSATRTSSVFVSASERLFLPHLNPNCGITAEGGSPTLLPQSSASVNPVNKRGHRLLVTTRRSSFGHNQKEETPI